MSDRLVSKIPLALARSMVLDTIATQNDFFRKMVFIDERLGQWVLTPGINARGPEFCLTCIKAVRDYTDFTADTDPYFERAMGSFEIEGEEIWWNIHLYNQEPGADAETTNMALPKRRVLTILFPSEIGGQKRPLDISSGRNRNERSSIAEKP